MATPNRQKLIADLTSAGYMSAADNVRHMCHPGNTAATLDEIANYHGGSEVGTDGAAAIIRRAIEQAERSDREEWEDGVNYQADAAARVVRDAACWEPRPSVDTLERMVGKFDAMASRLDDETGLDAADSLTWHVRQVIYNDAALVEQVEALTADHLQARDDCPICDGRGERVDPDRPEQPGFQCQHCEGGKCRRYPHQLGDVLKDWYEELAGVGGLIVDNPDQRSRQRDLVGEDNGPLAMPEPASAVLQAALAWIDWPELAGDAISTYRANHPEQAGGVA